MNIAVFCSSSNNVGEQYRKMAFELGAEIARRGHTLVYGGATGGLMDEIAKGAASCQGDIIGIIPEEIVERGRLSDLPTELYRVETLGERKDMMKEMSDLFVALPGGFGTLDEMMDAISACKLGETDARTILMNINGFYDALIAHISRFTDEGLGKANDNECYAVASTIPEIFEYLSAD